MPLALQLAGGHCHIKSPLSALTRRHYFASAPRWTARNLRDLQPSFRLGRPSISNRAGQKPGLAETLIDDEGKWGPDVVEEFSHKSSGPRLDFQKSWKTLGAGRRESHSPRVADRACCSPASRNATRSGGFGAGTRLPGQRIGSLPLAEQWSHRSGPVLNNAIRTLRADVTALKHVRCRAWSRHTLCECTAVASCRLQCAAWRSLQHTGDRLN